ncbi:MAG: hypothetical protein CM15mP111_3700 [Hyphomicrobiales bacterium]|nr:MAG: hypothetical protein CM15mP111_3700 [Hyphomicrobiales bacterium]
MDLINYFHSGSKSSRIIKSEQKTKNFYFIKIVVSTSIPDGPGIVDVFKILMDQFHWSPIFDGDNVIGLSDDKMIEISL